MIQFAKKNGNAPPPADRSPKEARRDAAVEFFRAVFAYTKYTDENMFTDEELESFLARWSHSAELTYRHNIIIFLKL